KPPKPIPPLRPRYEIRQLYLEHERWASAIVRHSNIFHSPPWTAVYPTKQNHAPAHHDATRLTPRAALNQQQTQLRHLRHRTRIRAPGNPPC
ncbi:hypothetical protein V2W45_1243534, partial [Cenococcum geophilum]